jgi:Na+/melibiose symporter-like transporter
MLSEGTGPHTQYGTLSTQLESDIFYTTPLETKLNTGLETATLPTPRVSTAVLYLYSIANFGETMAWSVSYALTTPFFSKTLSAGPTISHLIWLVGPAAGIFVAPIVGALSDNSTSRFGRRRPFIVAGTLAVATSMMVFSNSPAITRAMLSENANEAELQAASLVVAFIAFAFMTLALHTVAWPLRALQGDLVPPSQQHAIQGASVAVGSIGDLATQAMLSLFPQSVKHAPLVFMTCIIVLILTSTVMLFTTTEKPLTRNTQARTSGGGNLWSKLRDSATVIPGWLSRLIICNVFCCFALFCLVPNFSSWLGTTVLHGSPESVNVYGRAGILRSLLQMAGAAAYPHVLNRRHAGNVLGITFVTFGIILLALSNTNQVALGELVVVLFAVPMSIAMTLAIAEVSTRSNSANRCQLLGLLNVSTCLPQFIDTIYTGFVSKTFGEKWVIRIGGLWALVAGIAGFTLWPQ